MKVCNKFTTIIIVIVVIFCSCVITKNKNNFSNSKFIIYTCDKEGDKKFYGISQFVFEDSLFTYKQFNCRSEKYDNPIMEDSNSGIWKKVDKDKIILNDFFVLSCDPHSVAKLGVSNSRHKFFNDTIYVYGSKYLSFFIPFNKKDCFKKTKKRIIQ